nr:hypothetical protein [Paraflavitalea speifideiaquila]
MPDVQRVWQQMRDFCQRVHSGAWTGYTGKRSAISLILVLAVVTLGPIW